jgi:hypothetical protein
MFLLFLTRKVREKKKNVFVSSTQNTDRPTFVVENENAISNISSQSSRVVSNDSEVVKLII